MCSYQRLGFDDKGVEMTICEWCEKEFDAEESDAQDPTQFCSSSCEDAYYDDELDHPEQDDDYE